MTKREIAEKKQELCELRSQAITDFKEFFRNKKKELEKKNGKEEEPESDESEET